MEKYTFSKLFHISETEKIIQNCRNFSCHKYDYIKFLIISEKRASHDTFRVFASFCLMRIFRRVEKLVDRVWRSMHWQEETIQYASTFPYSFFFFFFAYFDKSGNFQLSVYRVLIYPLKHLSKNRFHVPKQKYLYIYINFDRRCIMDETNKISILLIFTKKYSYIYFLIYKSIIDRVLFKQF